MASSYSSFTPLESLLLFQSILQHGVEPEAFSRIASLLQANSFVRSDDRYNANRLTADSLRKLFLEELGGDEIDVSILPPLIERLYMRYRDHIVCAIREDEGRIEKMQNEIWLLEQQAAGGSGRGARAPDARAADAKAAAERQFQQQKELQQAQQKQQYATTVSPILGKHIGPVPAIASSPSTTVSASTKPASSTTENHVASFPHGAAAAASLLPATPRPDAVSSVLTQDRLEDSPDSQHQRQHQQQLRATQENTMRPLLASSSTKSPSRATSMTLTESPLLNQKGLAASPADQSASVTSHSTSQYISLSHISTSPTSQLLQADPHSLKTGQTSTDLNTTSSFNSATKGVPHSPPPAATSELAAQTAQTPIDPPASHAEMPKASIAAAQKPTPIAPVPLVPNVSHRVPPSNTPETPGPRGTNGQSSFPHPPLLEHVRARPPPKTATPVQVQSPQRFLLHTPVTSAATPTAPLPRGSGTRWKPSYPTPSTPGCDVGDIASPAYEPLSPVHCVRRSAGATESDAHGDDDDTLASSPSSTIQTTQRIQPSKLLNRDRKVRDRPSRGNDGFTDDDVWRPIKAETSSPRSLDEDVEEEELFRKRKRGGSLLARRRLVGLPTPPTHVLWMRGFPKISASALDQISSHRHANMFAHKIRDRDAPGYGSIVRHPVDLKSIRMAITQGNKAASATSAALGESSESNSVWLPISEDLVPPRGIINSSQLECELVHMFANAIMYNPDSHRGVGTAFLVEDDIIDDDDPSSSANPDMSSSNVRYQVDEDGVVNDTRDMYVEVEKLLSDMRSAERQRGMPPPPSSAKGLDLRFDENGAENRGDDEDVKETEDTGPDGGGTNKRRRIARGQQ
ncbi:hypothetical protein SEPCBS57363_004937 [Sporothrix epigloea]|uniref:Bromo domain-containing protein n=1 Tax=Sporothrix epigloea TaxID=1892477 RepID=A0ABP0DUV2_9PEZI